MIESSHKYFYNQRSVFCASSSLRFVVNGYSVVFQLRREYRLAGASLNKLKHETIPSRLLLLVLLVA
jgi:hypothetical protein